MKGLKRRIFVFVVLLMMFAASCFAELAPLPQPIGSVDGEWIYLGRFLQYQPSPTVLEWETRLVPYTKSGEIDNLFDVYFYHEHSGKDDGQGCKFMRLPSGGILKSYYACVLKVVPLDRSGQRIQKPGEQFATRLLSMSGRSKGAFAVRINRLRMFDSATHNLISESTDSQQLNGSYNEVMADLKVKGESPYYKAMEMSGCQVLPYDGSMG